MIEITKLLKEKYILSYIASISLDKINYVLEIFFFNLKNLNILIKIISFDEIIISYL